MSNCADCTSELVRLRNQVHTLRIVNKTLRKQLEESQEHADHLMVALCDKDVTSEPEGSGNDTADSGTDPVDTPGRRLAIQLAEEYGGLRESRTKPSHEVEPLVGRSGCPMFSWMEYHWVK